ncbi:glycerol kinase, partial [Endogone sp. FLAS-F59071]
RDGLSKLLIFSLSFTPRSRRRRRWIEHDPKDLLKSVQECIKIAVEKFVGAGNSVADIKAIGITNQRETTLAWDRVTGQPLHNALVWCDARTHDLVHLIKQRQNYDENRLRELCGLSVSTYFSAVKLTWLLENIEEVGKAAQEERMLFGTVDSWLVYNLTGGISGGVHITDVTNASRTMFMNIRTLEWDPELLKFFSVPPHCLPTLVSSSERYGVIASGPLTGTPITGCLGDQQAALVGQKCFEPGSAKNTYGTGAFLLFNTGPEPVISTQGLLTTVAYKLGPQKEAIYALEGSIAVAGSAVKFLRDNLGLIKNAAEVGELASQVKDTGGVYFVTAFSGLFAPYWRDDARGTIVGITNYTTKQHIARATLEAGCFQTRAILDAMFKESGTRLTSLRVDGGVSNSDIAMQLQADVLGIDVVRPAMRETTALGAAIAAGIAVGVWNSLEDLRQVNAEGQTTFRSTLSEKGRDARYAQWEKAVERSYGWTDVVGEEED